MWAPFGVWPIGPQALMVRLDDQHGEFTILSGYMVDKKKASKSRVSYF